MRKISWWRGVNDELLLPILTTFTHCPRWIHATRNTWCFQSVYSTVAPPNRSSVVPPIGKTQTTAVIGLLTGHNTLRRHLHVMGLSDNPTCRKCGTEEETSAHILCECEVLASLSNIHLGSFFWTRRILGYWGWGPSGTLLKEQGSYNLVQYWGHRGPVLRPRCIGPGGARTPFIFLFYSHL